jgi:two-component system sensor histidine kinase PilS (NtrC family)
VAAVDKDGTITLVNDAFEKIFNVANCIGTRWDDSVGTPDIAFGQIAAAREDTIEKEITLTFGGLTKTLLVAASKFRSEDDDSTGAVVVVYDITRLKEFERQSARRERLSEMGGLAAGVAHEIRNPLNTISIAAQRLASEFAPTADSEEYVTITNQIKAETKRLNEIINKFLALAREEEKRYRVIDLVEFIEETVKFFKPEAEKLKIELSHIVGPGLKVEADPDTLKQVFLNLFNNAKESLNSQPGKFSIAAQAHNDVVEIIVSDSGPGIRKELREKIFTPYFTTKQSGAGLGLPTVHKIISDLGGEVRVEESQWGGAKFVITLPQSRRSSPLGA